MWLLEDVALHTLHRAVKVETLILIKIFIFFSHVFLILVCSFTRPSSNQIVLFRYGPKLQKFSQKNTHRFEKKSDLLNFQNNLISTKIATKGCVFLNSF